MNIVQFYNITSYMYLLFMIGIDKVQPTDQECG